MTEREKHRRESREYHRTVPVERQLLGGLLAWLTADEANAWTEHLRQHPLYIEFRETEAELSLYEERARRHMGFDAKALSLLRARELELRDQLFTIAFDWYSELLAREQKAAEREKSKDAE